jgi:hypothetical protein
MLQMTLHLTRSNRLWTLLLLGLEVLLLRSEKKDTLTVSMEIHKGAIFDRLKIKFLLHLLILDNNVLFALRALGFLLI